MIELSRETMSVIMARLRKMSHSLRLGFHSVDWLGSVSATTAFSAMASCPESREFSLIELSSAMLNMDPRVR